VRPKDDFNARVLAWVCIPLALWLIFSPAAYSQNSVEYGGFLQESAQVYAETPNLSDAYFEADTHFHFWCRAPIKKKLSWRGAFDFQLDTHKNVDRGRWADLAQRGIRQPAGAVSEFYLDARLGHVDLRLGRQQIRWGRADGFNPTDNIISYDYIDTFADERLAVTALKADAYFRRANIEGIWIPFYTPTRLPILGQRWFPKLPASAQGYDLTYRDQAGPVPARTLGNGQWGVRYNQVRSRGEFSFSYFDGFDDIPFFRPAISPQPIVPPERPRAQISLNREYYRVHVAGFDFASDLGPIGIRGEAAYFDQTDPNNLDHALYVLGVDKTWGDWFVILQYAGQSVNGRIIGQAVFPDLGLRSTLIYRVERTLGSSRSVEIKGAFRLRDGDFLLQPMYTVALSNSWRLKLGATVFVGPKTTYLGQYQDSSHLNLQLRYSY
jgi:hypothetical protein